MIQVGLGSFATLFILLSIGHLLADWLFQTQHQFSSKMYDRKALRNHSITYTIIMCSVMIFFTMLWIKRDAPCVCHCIIRDIIIAIIFFTSHYLIDSYKPTYLWRRYLSGVKWNSFDEFKLSFVNPHDCIINAMIDQTLHLVIILFISLYIFAANYSFIMM